MTKLITSIKTLFTNLTVKKLLLILLLIIIVIFSISRLITYLKHLFEKIKTIGSTLSDNQVQIKVDQLKQAFDNYLPNNYEDVAQVFDDINQADYYKIKNAFGLVSRGLRGQPMTSIDAFLYPKYDLNQWLLRELSQQEIQRLKERNPNLPL